MITPPEVAAAFTEAAITALRELVALEASPAFHPSEAPTNASGEPIICATIDLLRDAAGKMALRVKATTGAALAAKYLPAGATLGDEIIEDVTGEMANVIAGQAKTLLKGTPHHFLLSTPKVERHETASESAMSPETCSTIRLRTEIGDFVIAIC